jgi:hypothetical protein
MKCLMRPIVQFIMQNIFFDVLDSLATLYRVYAITQFPSSK